jgi:tRNA A-37 threonylcarbamoyl transferase component Bud32
MGTVTRKSWAPPKPKLIENALEDRSPESLTREEIIAVLPVRRFYPTQTVVRISSTLLVKYGTDVQMGEARTMILAASIPGLHVPRVHDFWTIKRETKPEYGERYSTFILMDWIPGDCLGEIWQTLSPSKQEDIVSRILAKLQALNRVTLEVPGPVGGGKCRGFWFSDDGAGPFASTREMEEWYDERAQVCRDRAGFRDDGFSFIGYLQPLVLCHNDIHTHNVILDDADRLWLLDWGNAGAYPYFYERAHLSGDADNPDFVTALKRSMESMGGDLEIMRLRWVGFALTTGKGLRPRQRTGV